MAAGSAGLKSSDPTKAGQPARLLLAVDTVTNTQLQFLDSADANALPTLLLQADAGPSRQTKQASTFTSWLVWMNAQARPSWKDWIKAWQVLRFCLMANTKTSPLGEMAA